MSSTNSRDRIPDCIRSDAEVADSEIAKSNAERMIDRPLQVAPAMGTPLEFKIPPTFRGTITIEICPDSARYDLDCEEYRRASDWGARG